MQRHAFLLVAIVFSVTASGAVHAQHRGPRPGETDAEYSQRVNEEANSAALAALNARGQYLGIVRDRLPKAVTAAESAIREADQLQAQAASQTEFVDNVISLRNKSALDQEIDKLREKWNAKYGPRIGVINPYEGTSYYRYYDDKGNLAVIKFREAYDGAERMRKDFAQARKRALDAADKAEQEYQAAVEAYGAVVANQTKAAAAREAMQNWLNKIGVANTPRRPVATAPVTPEPATVAPDPAPSTGPYSVYAVRNGRTQRLGVRSTLDAAAAYGNRIRNTIGVTSVYVTDAQGNAIRRIR